jgi:coenzyme F420 biosynthesis associated uncharacterized protein
MTGIDWSLARRVARLTSGPIAPSVRLPGDLPTLAADAERRVVAYTGLLPAGPLPPPEAVDRGQWADINIDGMGKLLNPIAEKIGPKSGPLQGPLKAAATAVLAVEVGGLTGLLSTRVLGQFELVLLDSDGPTRLLFLAPNLLDAAQKLEVDPEQLVAWVAFHEVTHAVQFTAVPWLRPHLGGLLAELMSGMDAEVDWKKLAKLPSRDDLESMVKSLREDGLVMVLAGPQRRELLDKVQATMALIEGHAEHVMDAVGRDALPDLDQLREALDRRRANTSGPWKLLSRLLGLEMKMKQYEVGKRFCDHVAEREGVAALHRAFAGPESMPTWAELEAPDTWIARMGRALPPAPEPLELPEPPEPPAPES